MQCASWANLQLKVAAFLPHCHKKPFEIKSREIRSQQQSDFMIYTVQSILCEKLSASMWLYSTYLVGSAQQFHLGPYLGDRHWKSQTYTHQYNRLLLKLFYWKVILKISKFMQQLITVQPKKNTLLRPTRKTLHSGGLWQTLHSGGLWQNYEKVSFFF